MRSKNINYYLGVNKNERHCFIWSLRLCAPARRRQSGWSAFILLLLACTTKPSNKQFQHLPTSHTNIDFSNDITTTDSFNTLNFHYIYNGGGVGIGDFDKNGLPDIVFAGNQVPSKLYLDKGNLVFEDISTEANFQPKGWATGISIVDINADGWEDIYISIGGLDCQGNCKNQLFVHNGLSDNGQPSFTEQAAAYGLADGLYTQQAAFFDINNKNKAKSLH